MSDLIGLMLAAILFPLMAIQFLARKQGCKFAIWKQFSCVLLFVLSFAPYASFLFLADALGGLINLIHFVLVWMLFFLLQLFSPRRFIFIASIFLGLALMVPATSFITISGGVVSFDDSGSTMDLSRQNKLFDFLFDLYRIAWAVLPLLGFHYLIGKKPPTTP